jgi:hypothetical protein
LRSHERAAHDESGAKQLFDGAYALGDEKRVFFTRFPSVQITCKCK